MTIFAKKAITKLMTSSEQEKRLLFLIQLYCSKATLVLNVPAKFEYDWIKDKKQHLFIYRLFSAVFDTRQSKDDVIDVIVTSL